jgi:hypothetical protein
MLSNDFSSYFPSIKLYLCNHCFVLLHVVVLMLIVYECVSNLGGFRNMVDKRTALENLDMILLCLDEIVDGG